MPRIGKRMFFRTSFLNGNRAHLFNGALNIEKCSAVMIWSFQALIPNSGRLAGVKAGESTNFQWLARIRTTMDESKDFRSNNDNSEY